ncbi:phosphoribosylformylglycinamidine synthase subunit PurL [Trichonephila clavata]|uniref:Phosphoribosylformylglycinamidine synthase subunit PurL n=1 Tax=Trichonephila clavata TaxID=2740835 RepID=A0A8X6LNS3_TRICU|nr:phosphoribosylformylglycinamidine synthase subunit PurL [Trichonephila clavata]
MTEGRAGDTHSGVIPARDQEKKEWIPVSSTGMTEESTGVISSSNGAKPVNLNVSDQELEKISRDGIDGNGTLGLSLAAMKAIKDYFKKLNRNPYDIELESLAQTWSEHWPKNGDKIVIIGGRVGRDGIHGATFSSEALSGNSPSTIVQIGDPITQKKLSNAALEARDLGLYNAITDNGAGGLSSSIGEMGKDGFEVDLSKVLLKNDGMAPWEIWISESQERMTLAVPEENLPMFKQIMKKHDVEVCVIGEFNESGKAVVKCPKGKVIMDIETEFLHDGNPKVHLQTKPWSKAPSPFIQVADQPASRAGNPSFLEVELKEMLSRPNIRSKEFIVVQYDHEVQGSSILKPLQGKGRVCSEAIVSRPILSSNKGVVKSQGFGSSYGEIDTYHMAACAIDTAIRNYVAAGGNINHLALLDNFCWCDAYNPERLWQLKRAAEACYDFATAFKTPFISGKDSMFNNFKGYDENGEKVMIPAPPSLLISAIGVIENIENAVSLDVKMPGDLIYVLGTTHDELSRSEYQLYSGIDNNNVPKVDAKSARKLYERYNQAIKDGIIASAIAPNLGGLIIALAKSLIAGDLGAEIDLSLVPIGKTQNTDIINKIIMFSESQSRILVTIAPQNQQSETVSAGYKVEEKGLLVEHFDVGKANNLLSSEDKQILAKEIKTERQLLEEQDKELGLIKINGHELSRVQLYDFGTKINVEGSVPLLINANMNLSSKKFQNHLDKKEVSMTAREYLDNLKNSKNIRACLQT